VLVCPHEPAVLTETSNLKEQEANSSTRLKLQLLEERKNYMLLVRNYENLKVNFIN